MNSWPKTVVASLGDGLMAALTAYVYDLLVPTFKATLTALVILAVLVMVVEFFFHQYLLRSEKVAP